MGKCRQTDISSQSESEPCAWYDHGARRRREAVDTVSESKCRPAVDGCFDDEVAREATALEKIATGRPNREVVIKAHRRHATSRVNGGERSSRRWRNRAEVDG